MFLEAFCTLSYTTNDHSSTATKNSNACDARIPISLISWHFAWDAVVLDI